MPSWGKAVDVNMPSRQAKMVNNTEPNVVGRHMHAAIEYTPQQIPRHNASSRWRMITSSYCHLFIQGTRRLKTP